MFNWEVMLLSFSCTSCVMLATYVVVILKMFRSLEDKITMLSEEINEKGVVLDNLVEELKNEKENKEEIK